jgi:hypothetical protein
LDRIKEYPPKSINISGGDPLLVRYEIHKKIVNTLKEKGVIVKILFNPLSTRKTKLEITNIANILSLYDQIGVSLNTEEEINAISTNLFESFNLFFDGYEKNILNKTTIISNFNILNLHKYEKIEEIVKQYNFLWQIQFTVYREESELALYHENNEEALNVFWGKIQNSIDNNVKVIVSDNMNDSPCTAGIRSLGILYDGNVIGCLSERTWSKENEVFYERNLITESLRTVWEDGFKSHRFNSTKCCKDHCNNKCFQLKKKVGPIKLDWIKTNPLGNDFEKIDIPPYQQPIVVMYGVGMISPAYQKTYYQTSSDVKSNIGGIGTPVRPDKQS